MDSSVPVSLQSTRSTSSSKRGESRLVAEEWQLHILREQHQKQRHPSIEQRKLLATQTGLNVKWIASWFKRVNRKKVESLANGAPSQPQAAVTTCSSVSDHSLKSASVATEPKSSRSGGTPTPSDAVANSFLSGVVSSDSARSTSSHSSTQPWEEHSIIASELQVNVNRERERTIFCSHSQGTPPAALPVTRSHPATLYSQCSTANPLRTNNPVYSNPSFQHISPFGDMISHPADPPGRRTEPEPTTIHHRYHYQDDDVRCQSPTLAFPEQAAASQHDDPNLPTLEAVRMRSDSSVVLDRVAPPSQSPLAPLPSMYWFLFDNDGNSAGPYRDDDDASREPSSLLGNGASANPTPISFLAKWEDMLVLERRVRSSFDANLQQMKQAQLSELGQIKQGNQDVVFSLNESDHDIGEKTSTCLDHSQTAAGVPVEQRLSPASSMSSIFGELCDEEIPLLSDHGVE